MAWPPSGRLEDRVIVVDGSPPRLRVIPGHNLPSGQMVYAAPIALRRLNALILHQCGILFNLIQPFRLSDAVSWPVARRSDVRHPARAPVPDERPPRKTNQRLCPLCPASPGNLGSAGRTAQMMRGSSCPGGA